MRRLRNWCRGHWHLLRYLLVLNVYLMLLLLWRRRVWIRHLWSGHLRRRRRQHLSRSRRRRRRQHLSRRRWGWMLQLLCHVIVLLGLLLQVGLGLLLLLLLLLLLMLLQVWLRLNLLQSRGPGSSHHGLAGGGSERRSGIYGRLLGRLHHHPLASLHHRSLGVHHHALCRLLLLLCLLLLCLLMLCLLLLMLLLLMLLLLLLQCLLLLRQRRLLRLLLHLGPLILLHPSLPRHAADGLADVQHSVVRDLIQFRDHLPRHLDGIIIDKVEVEFYGCATFVGQGEGEVDHVVGIRFECPGGAPGSSVAPAIHRHRGHLELCGTAMEGTLAAKAACLAIAAGPGHGRRRRGLHRRGEDGGGWGSARQGNDPELLRGGLHVAVVLVQSGAPAHEDSDFFHVRLVLRHLVKMIFRQLVVLRIGVGRAPRI
mmetsp:Transcript_410/g.941  ORF Transcript_410/g.941 Transcript_410/m.941 type:complete len:425 (-) Transcript_410:933-2207(-)